MNEDLSKKRIIVISQYMQDSFHPTDMIYFENGMPKRTDNVQEQLTLIALHDLKKTMNPALYTQLQGNTKAMEPYIEQWIVEQRSNGSLLSLSANETEKINQVNHTFNLTVSRQYGKDALTTQYSITSPFADSMNVVFKESFGKELSPEVYTQLATLTNPNSNNGFVLLPSNIYAKDGYKYLIPVNEAAPQLQKTVAPAVSPRWVQGTVPQNNGWQQGAVANNASLPQQPVASTQGTTTNTQPVVETQNGGADSANGAPVGGNDNPRPTTPGSNNLPPQPARPAGQSNSESDERAEMNRAVQNMENKFRAREAGYQERIDELQREASENAIRPKGKLRRFGALALAGLAGAGVGAAALTARGSYLNNRGETIQMYNMDGEDIGTMGDFSRGAQSLYSLFTGGERSQEAPQLNPDKTEDEGAKTKPFIYIDQNGKAHYFDNDKVAGVSRFGIPYGLDEKGNMITLDEIDPSVIVESGVRAGDPLATQTGPAASQPDSSQANPNSNPADQQPPAGTPSGQDTQPTGPAQGDQTPNQQTPGVVETFEPGPEGRGTITIPANTAVAIDQLDVAKMNQDLKNIYNLNTNQNQKNALIQGLLFNYAFNSQSTKEGVGRLPADGEVYNLATQDATTLIYSLYHYSNNPQAMMDIYKGMLGNGTEAEQVAFAQWVQDNYEQFMYNNVTLYYTTATETMDFSALQMSENDKNNVDKYQNIIIKINQAFRANNGQIPAELSDTLFRMVYADFIEFDANGNVKAGSWNPVAAALVGNMIESMSITYCKDNMGNDKFFTLQNPTAEERLKTMIDKNGVEHKMTDFKLYHLKLAGHGDDTYLTDASPMEYEFHHDRAHNPKTNNMLDMIQNDGYNESCLTKLLGDKYVDTHFNYLGDRYGAGLIPQMLQYKPTGMNYQDATAGLSRLNQQLTHDQFDHLLRVRYEYGRQHGNINFTMPGGRSVRWGGHGFAPTTTTTYHDETTTTTEQITEDQIGDNEPVTVIPGEGETGPVIEPGTNAWADYVAGPLDQYAQGNMTEAEFLAAVTAALNGANLPAEVYNQLVGNLPGAISAVQPQRDENLRAKEEERQREEAANKAEQERLAREAAWEQALANADNAFMQDLNDWINNPDPNKGPQPQPTDDKYKPDNYYVDPVADQTTNPNPNPGGEEEPYQPPVEEGQLTVYPGGQNPNQQVEPIPVVGEEDGAVTLPIVPGDQVQLPGNEDTSTSPDYGYAPGGEGEEVYSGGGTQVGTDGEALPTNAPIIQVGGSETINDFAPQLDPDSSLENIDNGVAPMLPAEDLGAQQVVQEQPAQQVVQEQPAQQVVQEQPAQQVVQEQPAQQVVQHEAPAAVEKAPVVQHEAPSDSGSELEGEPMAYTYGGRSRAA